MRKRKLKWNSQLLIVASMVLTSLTMTKCTSDQSAQLTPTEIALTSVSAKRETTEAASHSSTTDDLLHDWLYGKPCQPPCWQGITPGQTSSLEAATILKSNPSVANVEVITATDYQIFGGGIYWDLRGQGIDGGSVDFGGTPPVVKDINVRQDGALTLKDVIDVYGQPSHVFASAGPCVDQDCTVYRLVVVFIEHGFALRWKEFPNNVHKPEFDSRWRDFHLLLFEPTLHDFGQAWGNPAIVDNLTPWRGMLGFDAYCVGQSCEEVP